MKSTPTKQRLTGLLLALALSATSAPATPKARAATQPTSQPTTQPTARTTIRQTTPPTTRTTNRPAAQPATRTATQPAQSQAAKPAPPKVVPQKPAGARAGADDVSDVTMENLLAADSYAVYGEMRGVGQYLTSDEFMQMLTPLRMISGGAPLELQELFDFVKAHSEQLMTARLAFGAMPVRGGLPSIVVAVEMSSAEDARALVPQLRRFAARASMLGGGQAADGPDDAQPQGARGGAARVRAVPRPVRGGRGGVVRQEMEARAVQAAERRGGAAESASPFQIRRAGAVVALADQPFTFKKLRGTGGAESLLSNEPGFQAARGRLASETVFIYFNTSRMGSATRHQIEEHEREQRRLAEEQERRERAEAARAGRAGRDGKPAEPTVAVTTEIGNPQARFERVEEGMPDDGLSEEDRARVKKLEEEVAARAAEAKKDPDYERKQREAEARREFENQLSRLIFSDTPSNGIWPESIGVAANLEGDAIVLRAFFVGGADDAPPRPLPFMPILHSGPQITAEAASVLPADTDIMLNASLDLQQMYDYVASMFKLLDLAASAGDGQRKPGLFDSQVSAFEQQHKFRIKEDLLNALGNELAVVLPSEFLGVRRARPQEEAKAEPGAQPSATLSAATPQPTPRRPNSPIFVLALNDKRAVQDILPRVLQAAGIAGVGAQQLFEKRGDAEVLAGSDASVAFLGRFLVASDPQTMRHVIDSFNEGQTLANSKEFRDPSGWQPRQVLGQVYVSNALLREMFAGVFATADLVEDEGVRAFLSNLNGNPGAITHAATKDSGGLLHELHVPRALLSLFTAQMMIQEQLAPMFSNEGRALSAVYMTFQAQKQYKEKHGRYGSLEELAEAGLTEHVPELEGYDLRVTTSGGGFEATATPTAYRKKGRFSLFINAEGQLRGGDLGGKPATASDKLFDGR